MALSIIAAVFLLLQVKSSSLFFLSCKNTGLQAAASSWYAENDAAVIDTWSPIAMHRDDMDLIESNNNHSMAQNFWDRVCKTNNGYTRSGLTILILQL